MLGQQLANGLTMGSIYALIAIGVSMIYKSLGMLNVAHGDTIMLSAFIALTLFDSKNSIVYRFCPLSIVITGFFGFVSGTFLFIEGCSMIRSQICLIATIGMSIVLRNSSILIWGAETAALSKCIQYHTDRNCGVEDTASEYWHYYDFSLARCSITNIFLSNNDR
ncbi:MAG: ABC transporter permease subunit [Lutisporaceae bacterium]